MYKIAVGSDHAGVDYKNKLKDHLEMIGYGVVDVGTNTHDSVNYPNFGAAVGKKVASGECKFGIVVCSTGIGISIAANKVRGVRCGIAYDDEVARLIRAHNDANVIAFGQNRMNYEDCERRLDIFLNTQFDGGRHATRVDLLCSIEEDKLDC
ncbi:MAG: ribose 5-phosphate isomerase B [Bacilli bacterium]